MKPEIDDVLFNNHCCSEDQMQFKEICKKGCCVDEDCPFNPLVEGTPKKIFLADLKGKYYPGFVKYFHSNYKNSLNEALKNPQKSLEARIQGNKLYAKKKHNAQVHEEIWKLYSRSIAFAPVISKELVLALECRSNLLLHFQKYDDCIKDIDRALAITEFDLLKVKLLCRKMTCFAAMNKDAVEKENLWLCIKAYFEKVDGALKDEKVLKIVKQARNDSSIPFDAETGNVKNDSDFEFPVSHENLTVISYGKSNPIVAKRNFLPGEIVAVTKPLIASINPDKFYAYCSHCSSFMWAGIPCEQCALCMYCSEKCRMEAWEKYHIMECKILPHLNFDNIAYYDFQTSVKAFLMGLREFGSIAELNNVVLQFDKSQVAADKSKTGSKEILSNSDFRNYYSVASNNLRHLDFCGLTTFSKHACFLLAYISQIYDIFEKDVKSMKGTELAKNKEFVSCGLLIYKIYSASGLSRPLHYKKIEEPKRTVMNEKDCEIKRNSLRGMVFDPIMQFLENSCNPNMSICYLKDGKIAYYCTQPIKESNQVTICMHAEFYKCNARSATYHAMFCRLCMCKVCVKNWPSMEKMFIKFKQRTSKYETEASKLVKKYLERNNMKVDKVEEENCAFNESEFKELARDVNAVVKVCGQPSFASSLMISFLCAAFVKLHGLSSLESNIPQNC